MKSKNIEKAVGTLHLPMEDKPQAPPAPLVKRKRRRYGRWLFLLGGIGLAVYLFTLVSSAGMNPESRQNARDYWTGQEAWHNSQDPMDMPQHLQEMGRSAEGPIDQQDPPDTGTGIPLGARPAAGNASQETPVTSTNDSVTERITLNPPQAWTQSESLPDRPQEANPPERQEGIPPDANPETITDFKSIQSNAYISVDGNGTRISWRIPTTNFRAYHPQRHPNARYPRGGMDNPPTVMTASCRVFMTGQQPPARFGRIRIPPDPSARPLPTSDSMYYWFRIITGYDINREHVDVSIGDYPAMRTTMALPMIQRELGPTSTVIDIDPLGIFQTFGEGRNAIIAAGNRRSISEIELPFDETLREPGLISAKLCNSMSWRR